MENPGSPGDSPGPPDHLEIIKTLARLRERPPSKDPRAVGCVATIVALITLGLMPFIGPALGLGGGAMLGIGIGTGLVALVGGLLGFYGDGFVRGAIAEDAEDAIVELMVQWPDGDPDVIREAAIRILDQSTVSTGPVTVETFDTKEVAIRLGPALSYVLGIERFLLERKEIYPVFTMLKGRSGSG